jgi:hypothetical protein
MIKEFWVIMIDGQYAWGEDSVSGAFSEYIYRWKKYKSEKEALKDLEKIKYKVVEFKKEALIEIKKYYFVAGIYRV